MYSASAVLADGDVDLEAEGVMDVTSRIMTRLCKEAKHFPGATNENKVATATTLSGPMKKGIPSVQRIVACSQSNLFPSAKDFLDIHQAPIYLSLDSAMVSPLFPTQDYDKLISRIKLD